MSFPFPDKKRPPMSPNSRPTSGTASPAHPFVHTPGTSTPVGTPPSIMYSAALGPMSSEYLHPLGHHPYGHGHHGHPLPPSRLGRTVGTISLSSHKEGNHQLISLLRRLQVLIRRWKAAHPARSTHRLLFLNHHILNRLVRHHSCQRWIHLFLLL